MTTRASRRPGRGPRARGGRDRPSREAYATRRLGFESDGERCVGTLYLPAADPEPPVVVMAPGFAREVSFGVDRYAERFAARGYAAFAFDYRGFGRSAATDRPDGDGSTSRAPQRGVVLPERQLADWRAAIDRVDGVADVGDARALWGCSLSGGHVLALAAERRAVDCVLAQTPLVDGRAAARRRSKRYLLRGAVAGLRDRVGARFGHPHRVKVYGDPDEFAVVNDPGATDAYARLIPRESTWQNRTPARALLALPGYRPVTDAADVTCPTLLVAGTRDAVIPYGSIEEAVARLADPTLVSMSMGHFDPYQGRFEAVLAHELAFLDATL